VKGRILRQALSSLEAVQLRLVVEATQFQTARLLVHWAAARMHAGQRMGTESETAKIFASDVAMQRAVASMRIHTATATRRSSRSSGSTGMPR